MTQQAEFGLKRRDRISKAVYNTHVAVIVSYATESWLIAHLTVLWLRL